MSFVTQQVVKQTGHSTSCSFGATPFAFRKSINPSCSLSIAKEYTTKMITDSEFLLSMCKRGGIKGVC